MDAIESQLTDLAERITKAWKDADNPTSILGELAAHAWGVLVFYQEQVRAKKPAKLADESVALDRSHWSDVWKERERGS